MTASVELARGREALVVPVLDAGDPFAAQVLVIDAHGELRETSERGPGRAHGTRLFTAQGSSVLSLG